MTGAIDIDKLIALESDERFASALIKSTTGSKNVKERVERATAIVGSF